MQWQKLGRIITEAAAYPTIDEIDGTARLYFACRDEGGRSAIYHVKVDPTDPLRAGPMSTQPLFPPGEPGTFDADGHAARCVVDTGDGTKLLYLIGWNKAHTVPYHLAIGCARSEDGGRSWSKLPGPVFDRSFDEPFLCTSPCVLRVDGGFRMWYCGGTGWHEHHGKLEPLYRIHHAESADGFHWRRTPHVCIDHFPGGDAIGWPVVWQPPGGGYQMLFCFRARAGYRDESAHGYRLGQATSADGLTWDVDPTPFGLDRSEDGWDSVMVAYPARLADLLFYNGNGFGATGIGVARLVNETDRR